MNAKATPHSMFHRSSGERNEIRAAQHGEGSAADEHLGRDVEHDDAERLAQAAEVPNPQRGLRDLTLAAPLGSGRAGPLLEAVAPHRLHGVRMTRSQ